MKEKSTSFCILYSLLFILVRMHLIVEGILRNFISRPPAYNNDITRYFMANIFHHLQTLISTKLYIFLDVILRHLKSALRGRGSNLFIKNVMINKQ